MNSEKNSKKKRRLGVNFCQDFVKITGGIPALLWFRLKRYYPYGKPKTKGGILVSSNHISYFDPFIVFCLFKWRRIYTLTTSDLFNTKVKAGFFSRMHCIEVDKQNFSVASFHTVVEKLEEGRMVSIFPEGQINTTGDNENPLTFKSGVTLMAHKSGAPILPLYIVKRDKWYHRQRVVIGKPVDVREMLGKFPSVDSINAVSTRLREEEMKLIEYYNHRNDDKKSKKENKSLQGATK